MVGLSIENLLGLKIKVTTILDTAIQGKVYAFDTSTDTIVIIEDKVSTSSKANTSANYRIVKTSFLKSVQVLNGKNFKGKRDKATFKTVEPRIGPVDLVELKAKESEAVRQQEKERQQALRDKFIENNVKLIDGINGKEIYRKVTKLFPLEEIKVRNESIIIFDSVKIGKPYQLDNVEVLKGANQLEKDKRAESSIEFVKNIVVDVNNKIMGG